MRIEVRKVQPRLGPTILDESEVMPGKNCTNVANHKQGEKIPNEGGETVPK